MSYLQLHNTSKIKATKETNLSLHEIMFCFFCFIFYLLWAINKPFNYAPDEHMRYAVSEFLFKNNRLPVGPEIKDPNWGFSYACLPTLIRHVLDFIFMKFGSILSLKEFHILLCARMVSVLCGTLITLFTIKTSKLLFNSISRWLMIGLMAFMPQFAFLSSYVNNDIVALLGVTLIMYSWIQGIRFNWSIKNNAILAVGVAICAASYYNSYAWILFSVILFIFTYLNKSKKDYKGLIKCALFICLIVFSISGYFFIRHLFYYRDILGIKTSRMYGELYAIEPLKPHNRGNLQARGISLTDMLFGENLHFVGTSYKSFIGCFGYMQYSLPQFIYDFYSVMFIISLIGLVLLFINCIMKKRFNKKIDMIVFCISIIFCAIITICLSIYNSYMVDFQPQGRYCYPAFPVISYFFAKGIEFLLSLLKKQYRYFIVGGILAIFAFISLQVYTCVYLPS